MTQTRLIQKLSDDGITMELSNGNCITKIDVLADGITTTCQASEVLGVDTYPNIHPNDLTQTEQWFVAVYRSLSDDDKNTIERLLSLMDLENAWGDDDE